MYILCELCIINNYTNYEFINKLFLCLRLNIIEKKNSLVPIGYQ